MLEVFIDGACEPVNPKGTASYGLVIKKDGVNILKGYHVIGSGEGMSNNVAEYGALLAFLKWCKSTNCTEKDITVKGDSQLVIRQMSGDWNVNGGLYYQYYQQCVDLAQNLNLNIQYEWIPREQNQEADELSKIALRKSGVKVKVR
jgi:ribonuclease HI